jgi:hypothetical protein
MTRNREASPPRCTYRDGHGQLSRQVRRARGRPASKQEAPRSGLALPPVIRAPKGDRSSCGPKSQGRLHSPAPLNLRLDGIIDSEVLDQEGSWAEQIRQRASTSTEHDPADPGLQQCCAAHWTRFGGAIERAAAEVALAQPTARLAENGEAVVGERIAMGDLRTARLGDGLAGSSHDGAEPRIASVGCRGRLIQASRIRIPSSVTTRSSPVGRYDSGNLCLSDPNHGRPGPLPTDTPVLPGLTLPW